MPKVSFLLGEWAIIFINTRPHQCVEVTAFILRISMKISFVQWNWIVNEAVRYLNFAGGAVIKPFP